MQREIVIKTNKVAEVSVEELYELRKAAFSQWKAAGLSTPAETMTQDQYQRCLIGRTVFVALDNATRELLAMRTLKFNRKQGFASEGDLSVAPKAKRQGIATKLLNYEVEWLQKEGYRYTTCSTAIPATWSVQWHLKNGYHIVGYSRSERNNYASYIFRKQIATDVRHHPIDLLWVAPIAPITAKIRYCLTWMAMMICKDKSGRLNAIGRIAKDGRSKMNSQRHTLT